MTPVPPRSLLSRGSLIREEVAAAHHLGQALQGADDGHCVQCGIGSSPYEPFPPHLGCERDQGDRRPDPWERTAEPSGGATLAIPERLLLNRHDVQESKPRTSRVPDTRLVEGALLGMSGGPVGRRDRHELGVGGDVRADERLGLGQRGGIAAPEDRVGLDQARL